MIKGAVDRMLERSIQFTERLQAIKQKLDSGVPVMEVREDFDQAIRSLGEGMNQLGLGPRGGMGGPGGMRGGGEGPDDRPDGPGVGGGDGPNGAGGPPLAPLGGRNAGRGAGGPGGTGGPPQRLTPEERTRLEAAMKTQAPTAFAELEAVRAKNPHAAERMFERLGPRLRLVVEHKEKAGADYEAKKADLDSFVDVMRAGRMLAEERTGTNKPEVIEQLRGQLRAAIGKQVDIRLKMQEEQLAELTHRAQKLREEIERNRANKDKFVEDRVSETMDAGKREGPKR
jgi:ribosomal protein S15P/S13E